MAFRLTWSRTSLDDLRSIVRYIAQDSPARAESFGVRIISRVEFLATAPHIGRAVPEQDSPEIREIILSPYRIIYRLGLSAESIEIVRIWHAARGEPDI